MNQQITATRTDGIITLTLADGTTTTRKGATADSYTHVLVRVFDWDGERYTNINFSKSEKGLAKWADDSRAAEITLVEITDGTVAAEPVAETVETETVETVAVTEIVAGQTVILDNGDRAEITGTAISSTGRMSLTFRRNGDFVTDSEQFDAADRVQLVPADEPVVHRDGTVTENGQLIGTVGRGWGGSYKLGLWEADDAKRKSLGTHETRAEAVAALVKHAHRYDAIDAAKNARICAARAARAA